MPLSVPAPLVTARGKASVRAAKGQKKRPGKNEIGKRIAGYRSELWKDNVLILDSKGKRGYRSVVFDVETTGLSIGSGDRVIEIGAVAIEGRSVVDEFHSLIQVDQPINPFAQMAHGITKEMLQGQPTADQVIPKFHKFIRKSLLVAHNASFDVRFMNNEFSHLKLDLNNVCFCTLKLGRSFYPDLANHELETLYRQFYKTPLKVMHRALHDARATAKIWMKLERKVLV